MLPATHKRFGGELKAGTVFALPSFIPRDRRGEEVDREIEERAMRRVSRLAFLAGMGALLMLSAAAQADKPKNDQEWLSREMTNGKAEVTFSEIALERAGSAKVKEFAEKMVKEHKNMNKKLAEIAKEYERHGQHRVQPRSVGDD
jgi:hypothetical protein